MQKLTLEDLEDSLQEEESYKKEILLEIEPIFKDAGFERKDSANNISFQSTEKDVRAQFNIDNTTYDYSCYISSEGESSINYSAKGKMDDIVKFVPKFVSELNDILVDLGEDELDVEEDDLKDFE